jgi:peptidyl-prolyl cis-trans isomerase D
LAKVGKEKLHSRDFYQRIDEQIEMYKMQNGDIISNELVFQIREEVFNEMIKNIILGAEYEKVGISISKDEMLDMMTGINIHPIIRQNFTDPQTGQFNAAYVTQYIMSLDQMEPNQQKQWYALEKLMKEDRIFNKYQTLIQKGFFVPKKMAQSINEKHNKIAQANIISLKYSSIPDNEISLSDEDFEKYYEENKNQYEQEKSRWLEYVIFDVLPNKNDFNEGEKEINAIFEEFSKIPISNSYENFLYVDLKSDIDNNSDTNFIIRGNLPPQIDSIFDMEVGTIVGPSKENNTYYIHKIIDKQTRADSINASHILVSYKGAMRADPSLTITKEEAKAKADSLFIKVKGLDSLSFAQIASENSNDASVEANGGNLGWFRDGEMISEFNEACLNGKIGDYFIVETSFGFHIINLKGKKGIQPKIKLASIKYTIEASSETKQITYTEASKFAGENQSIDSFHKVVSEKGYILRTAEQVKTSDYTIPGIKEGREIIRWAYGDDIEKGNVSEVFDLFSENKNVVVLVREVREKGIAPLSQIKDDIKPFVMKEKKAEILYKKMEEAKKSSNSISEIAQKLNLKIDTIDYINFSSPNVPLIGPEPKIVGTVFGTEVNNISKIIKGEGGIFVAEVKGFNETNSPETNYMAYINNQMGFFRNRVTYDVYNALLKKANIEENKVKFY